MRATLEQLKAMSDEELEFHWSHSQFPLEKLACGTCLTEHGVFSCHVQGHEAVEEAVTAMREWECRRPKGAELRPHLEELYALRLFYDSLYPPAPQVQLEVEREAENVAE